MKRAGARFLCGEPLARGRLGALPAAFNPLTVAHVALAEAAREAAGLDQVAFILPRSLPHKDFEGASFDDRRAMLEAAVCGRDRFAAVVTDGGLFHEIAEELRAACGPGVEIFLICGRDAAERIIGWDYGSSPTIVEQLERFRLLAGSRGGPCQPPPELEGVTAFELPGRFDEVSSSAVREAIRSGRPWRSFTPPEVAALIDDRKLYC